MTQPVVKPAPAPSNTPGDRPKVPPSQREFRLTDANYAQIQALAYEFTGIKLTEHKREMVYSRLARRIRVLRLQDFDQYCALIARPEHAEHSEFINAITTNLTAFFREPHHFDFLAQTALPALRQRNAANRRVRVWSAGCSTGEEPYSIAMMLREGLPDHWDTRILATDLDSNVVATGAAGVYPVSRVDSVSEARRKQWFLRGRSGEQVQVKDSLRQLIAFKRLNLLEPWPMKGPFDIIFCRNVVIYFDKPTQRVLFERFADLLAPGGWLFIGHSESLHRVTDRFRSLGKTMYQRV